MLLKNVRLPDREGFWKIIISDGRITRIVAEHQDDGRQNDSVLDAEGGLALPPFVEPHVHLDTTLTAGEPAWNISGTLFEGIERWPNAKRHCRRRM